MQDWAFVQRFALVKENCRPERWILHYIHHHHHIARDYRKTEEQDRKRGWTFLHAMIMIRVRIENPPAVLGFPPMVIGFPAAMIGFPPTMISTTPPG